MLKRIISFILALCITMSFFSVSAFAADSKKGNDYPVIFVHGLNGWGDDVMINDILPYWGATTGDITDYLAGQGVESYSVSVGAFSSAWDRACEVYAQLTGTTVDYGEAHSEEHSHSRYGRTYDTPIVPDWGETDESGIIHKIHLVGHSFGGETVRLLTYLLSNGSAAEIAASGDSVSPLFTGSKSDLVASVTTLASPHNSSTLYYTMQKFFILDLYLAVVSSISAVTGNTPLVKVFDPHLEQFGISNPDGSLGSVSQILNGINTFVSGTDNAVYDLTPEGSCKLNSLIGLEDNIYYFSYACSTTDEKQAGDVSVELPNAQTNPILLLSSVVISLTSRFIKDEQLGIEYDDSWDSNDGLVNTVSELHPNSDEWVEFDEKNIQPGVWNVMPVFGGDHGTVIGLMADEKETQDFYINLVNMLYSL